MSAKVSFEQPNPWRDKVFSRTLPPTFLFLQYSIVKEQTPLRRNVGARQLAPSDPVECRSRGSLEFEPTRTFLKPANQKTSVP
ncbi:hypothetical protein Amn_01980 [Aminobacter sp. Y103A]|nr:hypothetical protein Amn_01980 [Aminobacter sp. SS-2016]